jgi:PEP-utilising enzyme, PEP-binding domain
MDPSGGLIAAPIMKCVEARDALARSVQAVGGAKAPELGAMIETAGSLEQLAEIAAEADFLSIGTNDLTAAVLAADRFGPGRLAAHVQGSWRRSRPPPMPSRRQPSRSRSAVRQPPIPCSFPC